MGGSSSKGETAAATARRQRDAAEKARKEAELRAAETAKQLAKTEAERVASEKKVAELMESIKGLEGDLDRLRAENSKLFATLQSTVEEAKKFQDDPDGAAFAGLKRILADFIAKNPKLINAPVEDLAVLDGMEEENPTLAQLGIPAEDLPSGSYIRVGFAGEGDCGKSTFLNTFLKLRGDAKLATGEGRVTEVVSRVGSRDIQLEGGVPGAAVIFDSPGFVSPYDPLHLTLAIEGIARMNMVVILLEKDVETVRPLILIARMLSKRFILVRTKMDATFTDDDEDDDDEEGAIDEEASSLEERRAIFAKAILEKRRQEDFAIMREWDFLDSYDVPWFGVSVRKAFRKHFQLAQLTSFLETQATSTISARLQNKNVAT